MQAMDDTYEEEIVSPQAASACTICQSSNIAPLGVEAGGNGPKLLTRTIVQCLHCQHKFCPEPVALQRIRDWYIGDAYFDANYNHQNIADISDDSQWQIYLAARSGVMQDFGIDSQNGNGKQIIEIGCLEGRLVRYLCDQGWQAQGIEINTEVAAKGSQLLNIQITPSSVEEWNAPDNVFDAAISFHTFEHLRDPVAALRKVHKSLKVGGICLLEVPIDDEEFSNPDHLHFFSIESAEQMMTSVFSNCEIRANNYHNGADVKMGSLYITGIKK